MTTDAFNQLFTGAAGLAVSPLITLSIGVLLLLTVEITPGIRHLRPVVFVGSILAALWCQVLVFSEAPGVVLGGTFAADRVSSAWGIIFLCSTLVAWAFGQRYYKNKDEFLGEHDTLMLCTPIGMMMMASAMNFIVFFIGLELLSIPLYCLAAFRRDRNDSVEAGLKYLILGAFAVALFLFGSALIYTATGTLTLGELASFETLSPIGLVGLALMMAALFFKISVFPFHLWVPDVYQGSPTPITTLMATGTKAAAFAFLLNLVFLAPESTATVVGIIAVVTMAVGNLGALVQDNLKRMLAYSGVAHAGTVLLVVAGAIAGDPAQREAQAAIYYMAAYVFTAGGAFGLLSWLEADGEHFTKLQSIRGLYKRRPKTAAALALFMLSLGGIPATGGFLGKWLVFSVAVRADLIGLALIGILLSVVALGYYLRVVVALFMQDEPEGQAPPLTQRATAAFATAVCVVMVLLLGVLPNLILDRLI